MSTEDTATAFPILLADASAVKAERVRDAAKAIIHAAEGNGMPNARFNEAKSLLASTFSDAYNRIALAALTRGEALESLSPEDQDIEKELYYGAPTLLRLPKYRDKVAATKTNLPIKAAVVSLLDEMMPVAEALIALKTGGKLVKKSDDQAATRAAAEKQELNLLSKVDGAVRDLFTKVVDDNYKVLVEDTDKRIMRAILDFEASRWPSERFSATVRRTKNKHVGMISRFFNPDGSTVPDLKAKVHEFAVQLADDCRERFVVKNLRKIATVIVAKERSGATAEISLLRSSCSMASLEGQFRAMFSDGSSFEFKNAVVYTVSTLGKTFYRFPLTFHNAVLPDGSRMTNPSEDRMNTIFAAK